MNKHSKASLIGQVSDSFRFWCRCQPSYFKSQKLGRFLSTLSVTETVTVECKNNLQTIYLSNTGKTILESESSLLTYHNEWKQRDLSKGEDNKRSYLTTSNSHFPKWCLVNSLTGTKISSHLFKCALRNSVFQLSTLLLCKHTGVYRCVDHKLADIYWVHTMSQALF